MFSLIVDALRRPLMLMSLPVYRISKTNSIDPIMNDSINCI